MGETAKSPEGDELWRFSVAFYAAPGVERSLIALQDRDGFDINLILFALWVGLSGRGRLAGEIIVTAERATCTLRDGVVVPLRRLRRSLRGSFDPDVERLREGVKELELASEKLVQCRLARLVGHPHADTSLEDRTAAAEANLMLCLGSKSDLSQEAAVLQRALAVFVGES